MGLYPSAFYVVLFGWLGLYLANRTEQRSVLFPHREGESLGHREWTLRYPS